MLISINKKKLSISNNQFFNLLDELSKICNFNYGMIFKSINFENAIMYGSYGKNNDFFNFKKIDLSENDFVKLKEGYFRNLQETNFVTDIHLKRIADYYDLKKSIEKNHNLGDLQALNKKIYIWKMNTVQLKEAQKLLKDFNLIIE